MSAPEQIERNNDRECSLKLKYAVEVWKKALASISDDIVSFWGFRWIEGEGYYNELVSVNPDYEQCKNRFWSALRQIADSGSVKASEILGVIDNVDGSNQGKSEGTPRSYCWDQIKDMFVELTIPQLALLDGEKMNKCTDLDRKLLGACLDNDISEAQMYIERGANVNALAGFWGGTIINDIVEEIDHDFVYYMCRHSVRANIRNRMRRKLMPPVEQKAEVVIDFLLQKGADINLYGFGLGYPLYEACMKTSPEMVEFLLKRGANPNLFTDFADAIDLGYDSMFRKSEALDCIEGHFLTDGNDRDLLKIESLLLKYGASGDGYVLGKV